eukprot:scaffold27727_cov102-Isochrysis_galbana.AAC.3
MVPVAGGALGAASTPPLGPRPSENGDGASSADAGMRELSRTARPDGSVPRGANGGAPDSRYGSASADIMQRAAGQRKAGPPPAVMLAAAKMREARERAKRQENVVMGAKGSVVGDVAVLFGVRHINSVEAVRPSKVGMPRAGEGGPAGPHPLMSLTPCLSCTAHQRVGATSAPSPAAA